MAGASNVVFPTTLDTVESLNQIPGQGRHAVDGSWEILLQELQEGMVALQAKMGVDSSTVAASLDARAPIVSAGIPKSGPTGTGAGTSQPGTMAYDSDGAMLYLNEGTLASPYWSPVGMPGMGNTFGLFDDFRDEIDTAVAGSATSVTRHSGVRIHGFGLDTNDSGLIIQTQSGEGMNVTARLKTSADSSTNAVFLGTETEIYQPNVHGGAIFEAEVSMVSDILARMFWLGFSGDAIDEMVAMFTIASTTITLVDDDMAGIGYSSAAGNADALYAIYNGTPDASDIDTTDGSGTAAVDLSTDFPAAGSFGRYRVEMYEEGGFAIFIAKAQVFKTATTLVDVTQEYSPQVGIITLAGEIQEMDVKRLMFIANRST